MKYNKKNRGLQWQFESETDKGKHSAEIDAALARGRFARNEITGIEGLQGPYRLNGSRNEQFIIVISGTENVYLDGKRWKGAYSQIIPLTITLEKLRLPQKTLSMHLAE